MYTFYAPVYTKFFAFASLLVQTTEPIPNHFQKINLNPKNKGYDEGPR